MKYFNSMYLEFFKDLETNNNKQWFHQHKEIYQLAVDQPFIHLLEDVLHEISRLNPKVQVNARQALFRINRDLRFDRGKGTYKLFRSALISEGERKSKELPGFYMEAGVDGLKLGGGIYSLKGNFKTHYWSNWENHLIHPRFYYLWDELEFSQDPMSLTYQKTWPPEDLLRSDLLDLILEHWQAGQEINRFFWNS